MAAHVRPPVCPRVSTGGRRRVNHRPAAVSCRVLLGGAALPGKQDMDQGVSPFAPDEPVAVEVPLEPEVHPRQDPCRRRILGIDTREDPSSSKVTERKRDDGLHRFGGNSSTPMVAAKVVAELGLVLPSTVQEADTDQALLGKDNRQHVALAGVCVAVAKTRSRTSRVSLSVFGPRGNHRATRGSDAHASTARRSPG